MLLGAVLIAGCGDTTPAPTVTVTEAATPAPAVTVTATVTATPAPAETSTTADPYETYLANNPEPDHVISRDDAQTRAYLGCGQTFAPGTVDAVLQEAYAGICPE